jgi:hypothetical protein
MEVSYFKILSRYSYGMTVENQEELQDIMYLVRDMNRQNFGSVNTSKTNSATKELTD